MLGSSHNAAARHAPTLCAPGPSDDEKDAPKGAEDAVEGEAKKEAGGRQEPISMRRYWQDESIGSARTRQLWDEGRQAAALGVLAQRQRSSESTSAARGAQPPDDRARGRGRRAEAARARTAWSGVSARGPVSTVLGVHGTRFY